jgi:hypothetical protein
MTTYIEKILWTLIKSSFSKSSLCHLLMSLTALIIRVHLDSICSLLLATNLLNNLCFSKAMFDLCVDGSIILNFITRTCVSCCMVINGQYLYNIVCRYEPEFYKITQYFINNYTEDNFKKWKRNTTLIICMYLYLIACLIDITNQSVKNLIVEYIICYFLIDMYTNFDNIRIVQFKKFECLSNDDKIVDSLIKSSKLNANAFDAGIIDIKK